MRTAYDTYRTFPGWDGAAQFFGALARDAGSRDILEIGAGANPTLPPAVAGDAGASYTTNDVCAAELAKAGPGYRTLCADIATAAPGDLPRGSFDFVFSRMVNEHVVDGERYYRNIHGLLRPGGLSAHCFSTLYALPFVANRLLPEGVASRALDLVNPRDRHRQDKFRAYYSWSRGPTARMQGRLRALGFEIVEFRGYFGHPYYNRPMMGPLRRLEDVKAAWLSRHPIALLTSYAALVLRKPAR